MPIGTEFELVMLSHMSKTDAGACIVRSLVCSQSIAPEEAKGQGHFPSRHWGFIDIHPYLLQVALKTSPPWPARHGESGGLSVCVSWLWSLGAAVASSSQGFMVSVVGKRYVNEKGSNR